MGYTTPSTWVAGNVLTAAQLNQQLRDNVAFLANPPACAVFHNTTQSVADEGTGLVMAANSEFYDTDSMHDNVTNNSRITINTAGLYVVSAHATLAAAADYVQVFISITASDGQVAAIQTVGTIAAGPFGDTINCAGTIKLAAAAYLQCTVGQNNEPGDAARNVTLNRFSATWVGLG